MTSSACPSLASRARIQPDLVTGDQVLLYPEGVLVLNSTAHAILCCCDGQTSVEEIVRKLGVEYDASPDDLRDDVLAYLSELQVDGLILSTL